MAETITTTSLILNQRRRSPCLAGTDMEHGKKIPPGSKKTLRRRKNAPATDVTDTVNGRKTPQGKTKTKKRSAPAMVATAMVSRTTSMTPQQGTRRKSQSVTHTTTRILAKVESGSRTIYSSQIIFQSIILATSSTSSSPSLETTQLLIH
jgi:hypothetical protein